MPVLLLLQGANRVGSCTSPVHAPRRILLAAAVAVVVLSVPMVEGAVGASGSALVASASACPGSRSMTVSAAERRTALVCLVNYARTTVGLRPVRESRTLTGVAHQKGHDVVTCRDFAHTACGKDAFAYVVASGFPYRFVGENLYLSEHPVGSARDAFVAWLRSPSHRRVMFLPRFSHAGTAVLTLAGFSTLPRAELWVLELAQRHPR